MQLKWLQLENFRNYTRLELDLDAPVTALVGPNAQGKTNVLESVAFLALGKSFRARKALETLGWERPHGRIRGRVEHEGKETQLEVFFQRSPQLKKVKVHDALATPKEFLGHLRVVLFTPEHLHLITGSPSLRRQYMDRTLVQLHPIYLDALSTYHQVLKQRNALLKRIQLGQAQAWELDLWDARLVQEACTLWKHRRAFMEFLRERIGPLYQTLAATAQTLTLHQSTHEDNYDERLIAHRDQDIKTGSTGVGPHRDDFHLQLDAHALADFGSRGECRSGVLALKVAEIDYMEQHSGQKPLLLLDDVFSELDEDRQIHLGELIAGCQTIITTTAMEHLQGLKNPAIYQVKGGELHQKV